MSISSFKKGPNIVTDDFQNAKVLFGNENMLDNKKCFPIYGELDKNQNISNSEDVTSSIDSQQNTDKSTSIQNDDCYNNNEKHSEVIDFVEYEILRSNDFQKAQNVKIAGKVSDKDSDWYTVPHPDFFWAYCFLAVKDWIG